MASKAIQWYLSHAFGWLFSGKNIEDIIGNLLNPFKGTKNALSSNDPMDLDKGLFSSNGLFGDDNSSGSRFSDLINALVNRVSAEHLTGAEQEANAFSHNEALLQRDWQEYFYNQYQSPQAQVQQYQQAGLNPALMYQGVGSPSAVSSSSPSSVSPQGSQVGLVDLVSSLAGLGMRMQEMKADLALKSANTSKVLAEADLIGKNVNAFDQRLKFELEILGKKSENISADTKVKYVQEQGLLQGVEESKAREAVYKMDEALKKVDYQTRSDYNNAALACLNAQRNLYIAETNLRYSEGRKTEQEVSYMKIKVKNAQEEYDKVFAKMDAEIDKITKEAGLTEKESDYFKDKFNLQVISTVTGAVNAAKFAPGTRFQGGNFGFTRFLDDMGSLAKSAGSKIRP